ncbi:sensor histidine kinase [Streptomyces candidus]|uniref:histidine kinase n=1 Tax=Streptomyces candidus TaxID=67283 RepID=A0A7X0HEN7_9ACTN|nr:histidine kinase [Streptomyces candidus]MBB6436262.1 signal transduction histidine kinase [Streptomyces candidus]GHH48320.1 two-component sensor histidine kinase [Streptomyces candidus]
MDDRVRARWYDLGLWLAVSAPPVMAADALRGRAALMAAVGVPLLALAVAAARRWPLGVLVVPLALNLAHDVELLTLPFLPALTAFAFLAGVRAGEVRAAARFFGATAAAGLPVCVLGRDLWSWPSQLLMLLLTVGLPWLLGRWWRQYAELVRSGWRLADRMEREQRAVADRTRMRERARIASDMHDSLGHDLTLLAVRAAALEVDRSLDARQQAAVGELREAAADATGRLREIIGVLRTDEAVDGTVQGAAETPEAVVERARSSGLDVALEQRGEWDGLPPMVGPAVHRVLQEALTNAAKHAPGAPIRVEAARDGDTLRVTVANGPAGSGAPSPGLASGGAGLVGLDERVRLAGGTLRAGAVADGGFEVHARLPAVEGAVARERGAVEDSLSVRELQRARKRVRRSGRQAVLAPLAVLAGICVVLLPVSLTSSALSVLDREGFDGLRVGETREEVAERLPVFDRDGAPEGAPEEPPGAQCAYFHTRLMSDEAYRLCFSGGRLVSRGVVPDL